MPDTLDIHLHDGVPLILGDMIRAAAGDITEQSGVIDHDINAAKFLHRQIRHGLAAVHFRHIQMRAHGLTAGRFDAGDGAGGIADIGGDYKRALGGHRLAIGPAQAASAARDNDDLFFQLHNRFPVRR